MENFKKAFNECLVGVCNDCPYNEPDDYFGKCRERLVKELYDYIDNGKVPQPERGKYWDKVTAIYDRQRKKGITEYGHTLEDNQIPDALGRLCHIEEELVDSLMYLEWLKDALSEKKGSTRCGDLFV